MTAGTFSSFGAYIQAASTFVREPPETDPAALQLFKRFVEEVPLEWWSAIPAELSLSPNTDLPRV